MCREKQVRVGPLSKMPRGKYKGKDILWVIKEDPYEFMVAVKEYLQISEEQARVFKKVTKGGKIPESYIFRIQKKTLKQIFEEDRQETKHSQSEEVPVEENVPFTPGHNIFTWMSGKDIEEDKSFL